MEVMLVSFPHLCGVLYVYFSYILMQMKLWFALLKRIVFHSSLTKHLLLEMYALSESRVVMLGNYKVAFGTSI